MPRQPGATGVVTRGLVPAYRGAVASEYGERLIVGPETVWTNVPLEMRARITAGSTVDSRYDDLENRRVEPIDGEEASKRLRDKSERRRSGSDDR